MTTSLPPLPLDFITAPRAFNQGVALVDGEDYVYFVSRSGGWTTVERFNAPYKVRNGKVRVLTQDEITELLAARDAAPPALENAETSSNADKSGVVLKEYRRNLHRAKVEIDGKRRTLVDCNDQVAQSLRGKSLDEVYKIVAEKLQEAEGDGELTVSAAESGLRAKYVHLNPGQQRMNLGNILRRLIRSA
jgi:hypothetical protein